MAAEQPLSCPCGEPLGALQGNWLVYPNPPICRACGLDNAERLRDHMLEVATAPKKKAR
jgi:hypothetical protein